MSILFGTCYLLNYSHVLRPTETQEALDKEMLALIHTSQPNAYYV